MAAPADKRPAARARQWYELRTIRLRTGQPKAVNAFLSEAALPAWRRHGVGPGGGFEMGIGPQMPALVVLLPHDSPAALGTLPAQLVADAAYQRGAGGRPGGAPRPPPLAAPG